MAPNDRYSTLRYSMDTENPFAIGMSKSMESYLRQVISQFQKEGEAVLRTQRSMSGTTRNTDYFVPSAYVNQIKQAAAEQLSMLKDKTSGKIGLGISSGSEMGFKVHQATILDSKVRAEIAAMVRQNGGYFNAGKGGSVEWGIGTSMTVGEEQKNLSRVLAGKISASNAAYSARFNGLTGRAGGVAGVEDLANEREATFARLARRGRMENYSKEYAKANPDDPLVRAEKMKAVGAGAKFTGSAILTGIGLVVGFVAAMTGLLEKIRDGIVDIGNTAKRQALGDQRYNFDQGTMQGWERFAAKKGFDKNLMPNAAGVLQSQWANPLTYSSAPFAKLAVLGVDIDKMTSMARAGGDQNVLGMMDSIMDTIVRQSYAGKTAAKSGLTPSDAFAENLELLRQAEGDSIADMTQNYWNEMRRQGASPNSWMVNGVRMSPRAYYTQGSWNSDFQDTSIGTVSPAVNNADQVVADRARSAGSSIMSVTENLLRLIVGNTGQWIEDFRAWVARGPIGKLFPAWAEKESMRNTAQNVEAQKLVSANMPGAVATLNSLLKLYGISGGSSDAASIEQNLRNDKYGAGAKNDARLTMALSAYLGLKEAQALLTKESVNAANDPNYITGGVAFTPSEFADSVLWRSTVTQAFANRNGRGASARAANAMYAAAQIYGWSHEIQNPSGPGTIDATPAETQAAIDAYNAAIALEGSSHTAAKANTDAYALSFPTSLLAQLNEAVGNNTAFSNLDAAIGASNPKNYLQTSYSGGDNGAGGNLTITLETVDANGNKKSTTLYSGDSGNIKGGFKVPYVLGETPEQGFFGAVLDQFAQKQ